METWKPFGYGGDVETFSHVADVETFFEPARRGNLFWTMADVETFSDGRDVETFLRTRDVETFFGSCRHPRHVETFSVTLADTWKPFRGRGKRFPRLCRERADEVPSDSRHVETFGPFRKGFHVSAMKL